MSSTIYPIPSFFPLASFLEPKLRGIQQLSRKRQLQLLERSKQSKRSKNEQIDEVSEEEEDDDNYEETTQDEGSENDEPTKELVLSETNSKTLYCDSKKQFHGYYKKEISVNSYFNIIFQLRILTKQGVRLEYISLSLPFSTKSELMKPMTLENPLFESSDMPCFNHVFSSAKLGILGWNQDICSIDLSNLTNTANGESKAKDVEDSGDDKLSSESSSSDDDFFRSSDEEEEIMFGDSIENLMKNGIKDDIGVSQITMKAANNHSSQENGEDDKFLVGLWMSDANPENVLSVNIEIFPPASLILPHPQKAVVVQNACGSCTTPYQLDLSCFKHLSKKKKSFSSCESLSMVTATFVLCSNRCRVDFRGARSMESMAHDWKLLSGLALEEVSTSIYLLVLKGCIGYSLVLTSETCFLANTVSSWCSGLLHFDDVCDILELRDIKWDAAFPPPAKPISKTTRKAQVKVNISRRGGAVIRMVFPKNTPWDASCEKEVISDCNRLLQLLNNALAGKITVGASKQIAL